MADKVKIYSTPGCNPCDQAKRFLSEKGVEFDLVDVSRDAVAFEEMRKISKGARTAPIISVCDKVLLGFKKEELEEAVSCL